MGVVELRAIRMPERPGDARGARRAVPLDRRAARRRRTTASRSSTGTTSSTIGSRCPSALSRDLRLVLGDLDEHGLGLPAPAAPRARRVAPAAASRAGSATRRSTLRPALEFWPLVGDVASQERRGARIVDASTQRWEIAIDGPGPERVGVGGKWCTPARARRRTCARSACAAASTRRRPAFTPACPRHRSARRSSGRGAGRAQRIELWAWRPERRPVRRRCRTTTTEALARRQERIRITTHDGNDLEVSGAWPDPRSYTLDTRRG